jgi:hypothetical protein
MELIRSDITYLRHILLVLRSVSARLSTHIRFQSWSSRSLLLNHRRRMSDRSHWLPCLPDILLDSRYQKKWATSSGTSFDPSSAWCLHTTNGIFHVRLDSSSRSALDRQLDWCGHFGHVQLSHIPMPFRIPSTFLPKIRGISICSK